MLIPISTDAPLYHRPLGTLTLIAVNLLCGILLTAFPDWTAGLLLPYGHGLTPVRWATSLFVHAGWVHLLGNMIFLWGFGIVIEGKLGAPRFVCLYLTLGILSSAIEQLLFWNSAGGSLGASATIFALLGVCLIWAPANELTLGYWFILRVGAFDIPIVWFALLLIAKSVAIYGFNLGGAGELAHVIGAVVGVAVGSLVLRHGLVDCEGWDLYSWLQGRPRDSSAPDSEASKSDRQRRELQRRARSASQNHSPPAAMTRPVASPIDPRSPERFQRLLAESKPGAAFTEWRRLVAANPDWRANPVDLLSLARVLRKQREFANSGACYAEVCSLDHTQVNACLEYAELLVLIEERPGAARRLLEAAAQSSWTPEQLKRRVQLEQRIQQLLDSGVLELEGRAWR